MRDLTDAELDDLIVAIGLGKRRPGPKPTAPCGTDTAYHRHRNNSEEPCQPCRDAHNAAERARYASEPQTTALAPIAHGTSRGARQHWYRKVPICGPCREAYNEDQQSRRKTGREA